MFVRLTKTKSQAIAVQVVRYERRKLVVLKHIGSTHNFQEVPLLKQAAYAWIAAITRQLDLFLSEQVALGQTPGATESHGQPQANPSAQVTPSASVFVVNQSQLLSAYPVFSYEILGKVVSHLGFTQILLEEPKRQLLLDLVVARLIHPCSKISSLQFLNQQFGIYYPKNFLYQQLSIWGRPKIPLKIKLRGSLLTLPKPIWIFLFRSFFMT